MATVSANRLELLQIADAVAREKAIDRKIVLGAMEDAIAKAARSRYGSETEVRAEIDPKSGELHLSRHMLVVDTVENPATQISLDEARRRHPAAQIGDTIADPLPPLEYGRIAAQSAKQVIVQKVREAERDRQYDEYKDRIGDIVNGIVKRVEYGNVVVDLGRGEAIVRRDEMLPREVFRNGDRIRAYIYDVRREQRGPQIFLSRTHPQFMAKLFAQEVPEIYDGIVEVKAVARDPGSRAKIAVISRDSSVDPVGACVGMRGSRVQAVVNELQGEKIDIIPWSHDIATFVVNALAPAEVAKVVLDEERERIEVVVPDQQLSLAIGRRGQNVRLASQLTGWDIDILTEQEESERRQAEFENRTRMFIDTLNVDEVIGQLLASEGFNSVEELAMVDPKEIASIEGFDEDTAAELQNRAREYLDKIEAELDAKRKELGVEDAVKDVEGVTTAMLVRFGENGIKTVEDLAGCATDDLVGWTERKDGEAVRQAGILDGFELSREEAEALIMNARLKAGWITEADLAPAAPAAEEPAAARATVKGADIGMTAATSAIELDDGPRARSPERLCVATRAVRPVADLIRFVVGPDGKAVPDLKSKLPGRGVWVTATQEALGEAIKRKAFPRGFKRDVRVPPDLIGRTESLLERSALDALAIAGKAGLVAAGFTKVEKALAKDNVVAVLHAAEAAADGSRKLDAALRRGPSAASAAVIRCLTLAQLDLALGHPNVVHAALLAGPSSETFLTRLGRLERFRSGNVSSEPGMAVAN